MRRKPEVAAIICNLASPMLIGSTHYILQFHCNVTLEEKEFAGLLDGILYVFGKKCAGNDGIARWSAVVVQNPKVVYSQNLTDIYY